MPPIKNWMILLEESFTVACSDDSN